MDYPDQLQPNGLERITLPTGVTIEVPKATPTFTAWAGPVPEDTYNGKAILQSHGRPAFAELVILRAFQDHGWDGVWIDTYRKKFRTGYWGVEPRRILPTGCPVVVPQLLETWSGAWDVCCWRGNQVVFAESKRRGRDQIRDSQRRFLAKALEAGIPAERFLMVEWEERPVRK